MTQLELTMDALHAGLDHIRQSPTDVGTLDMIVCRPESESRELLQHGELDLETGLVGDNWKSGGSKAMPDGSAHPEKQITIMNSRAIALIAQTQDRWALAGDQLYLDLDLSPENLPTGTRLKIGSAVLEITEPPHNGCQKFRARFGTDALKFVNSTEGKALRLRGIHAKIVQPGTIRVGDVAQKD